MAAACLLSSALRPALLSRRFAVPTIIIFKAARNEQDNSKKALFFHIFAEDYLNIIADINMKGSSFMKN
jgi:hypothetical protein